MKGARKGVSMKEIIDHLTNIVEGENAQAVASARGSFEGWIRGELIVQLLGTKSISADDIGVEYTATLKTEKGEPRPQKRVDLWVRARPKGWHYLELKVVFNNAHQEKQFGSWRSDFEALKRLANHEQAAGVASFAIGVWFDESGWEQRAGQRTISNVGKEKALRLAKLERSAK